jgi:hypothetical protein
MNDIRDYALHGTRSVGVSIFERVIWRGQTGHRGKGIHFFSTRSMYMSELFELQCMRKVTHRTESLEKEGVQVLNHRSMGSQRLIGSESMKQRIQIQKNVIRVFQLRKKRFGSI